MANVEKVLTENQQKVLDFMSPGAVFTRADLLQLTRLQANQLTPILRSLCVKGKIEEFVDEDDPALTVQYRLADAPGTLDEIPANTTPEDAADFVLDLSQGEMVEIPMDVVDPVDPTVDDVAHANAEQAEAIIDRTDQDVPTTGEMGAYFRPDLAPTPIKESAFIPKGIVPFADVVELVRSVYESGHQDPYGMSVKEGRRKWGEDGSDVFALGELGQLVLDAQKVLGRERMGLPHAGDPIDLAMAEEQETWKDLSSTDDVRIPAIDYITRNIKGREDFDYLPESDIREMVKRFLSEEEPTAPSVPAPTRTLEQTIQAKIDAKNKAKLEKEQNKPAKNGGDPAKPSTPKTDFSSEQAGAYYIRHGIHKGTVKYSAYWASNKKYVRQSITTERMTYHPQIFAATQDAVIAKMNKSFPNATFTGDVLESDVA